MGLSTPSTTCDRTAPTATSEASVSRMHGSLGCGSARVVASSSACFKRQNASSASSSVIPCEAQECTNSAQAMWCRPIANNFERIRHRVYSLDRYTMTQELNVTLKWHTFRQLDFQAYFA